jgi:hypothetical protein
MLVSLSNGGVHVLNQTGWNTGSNTDISDYNSGPAMWLVYAASATLQDTFPGGHNRYPGADTGGTGTAVATSSAAAVATSTATSTSTVPPTTATTVSAGTGTSTGAAAGTISTAVNVLIGEADPITPNAYILYLSAPSTAQQLIFCTTATANACTPTAAGYTEATYSYTIGDQAIFQAAKSTPLSDGLQISVVAGDASGNPTAARTLTVTAASDASSASAVTTTATGTGGATGTGP